MGERWSDGSSRLELWIDAVDDNTSPLTVTASTPPSYNWPFSFGDDGYFYNSSGNEGLSSGAHTLTFTIKDGASPQNTITFQRDIYIFDSWPNLSSPSNGVSGVSTTPTFEWNYSGSARPLVYILNVFNGPNRDTARQVWSGYAVDKGPGTYSLSIPVDKHLAPNTTYYWEVSCQNYESNGEAYSAIWSFTTGGTPPPSPYFEWVRVFSDDRTTGILFSVGAKVLGPSPADIVELNVTGPGGFKYIFNEDNILQSEQGGLFFWSSISWRTLSDGNYTFTVTDLARRTATENYSFTNPSATIPRVNSSTMVPADSSYVNTTTPTFSWSSVGTGYYYRLQIMDWNSKASGYLSDYTQSTEIKVPSGYLLTNTPYKWRVEVFDAPEKNRSVSNTLRFSTGSYPYTLDLNWGIVWSDNDYYGGNRKSLNANVIGPLPNQITQLSVSGPGGFNFNFAESNVQYNLMITGSLYSYAEAGFPGNGAYNFYVQDIHGGTDSYNKSNQISAAIPIVDQASMSPANNAYLYNVTPTFTWGTVAGANLYYRVTINDWKTNYTVYQSPRSTNLSVAIPAEVLKKGASYKWRVEVFDDSDGLVVDNRSSSGWNCFTTVKLLTSNDFNGDGKPDIVWRNKTTGQNVVWLMDGTTFSSYAEIMQVADTNWQIVGTGDFNGDGKTDILWRNKSTGQNIVWLMDGTTYSTYAELLQVPDTNWQIVGTGDFNGDGKTDILWRNKSTGQNIIWLMDGTTYSAYVELLQVPDTNWQIVGTGDFNGDGKTDILWRNKSTGQNIVWFMDGTTYSNYAELLQVPDTNWEIVGTGDFNGDGKTDILWRNKSTGQNIVWFMDGTTYSSYAELLQVADTNWEIVGPK
jgi:hypothetical protein